MLSAAETRSNLLSVLYATANSDVDSLAFVISLTDRTL